MWGGAKRLLKFKPSNKSFLYLTYYDNYDSTTLTDTPKIGDPVTYSVYKLFVPASVLRTYGDYQMPFLCNSTTKEGNLWNGYLNFDLPQVFSLEWIENYPTMGTSSFGMPGGFKIGKSSNRNIGICLNGVVTNVIGLEISDYYNSLQSGWYSERNYRTTSSYTNYVRYYYRSNNSSLRNTNIHIAIVVNLETRLAKIYYNGSLAVTHNFSSLTDAKYISINPGYWYNGYQAYRTQFCVRNGDFSINEGINYKVPEAPYWDFNKNRLRSNI